MSMFKRILLEDWYQVVPYVGFALVSGIFTIGVIYAIRMKKTKADYLANLPLMGDEELKEKNHDKIENE